MKPRFVLAASQQIDTKGLIAHYKLDHSAFDYSLNGNDGTLSGSNIAAAYPGFSFNGSDDQVNCGDINPSLTDNITISAWVKFSNITSEQPIVAKWGTSNISYLLYKLANNAIRINIGISATRKADSSSTVSADLWYHVVGVSSTTDKVQIYFNGALQDTSSSVAADISAAPGQDVLVGTDGDKLAFLNGILDDVRIYNVAKTADEIKNIYETSRNAHGV